MTSSSPDLKLDNIQTTLPDDEAEVLVSFVSAEERDPSPRKYIDDTRTIYTSRQMDYGDILTFPILSDLGTCVYGQDQYDQVIQAMPYRAPEVVLRTKWSSSADIWNLGVLVSRRSLPIILLNTMASSISAKTLQLTA